MSTERREPNLQIQSWLIARPEEFGFKLTIDPADEPSLLMVLKYMLGCVDDNGEFARRIEKICRDYREAGPSPEFDDLADETFDELDDEDDDESAIVLAADEFATPVYGHKISRHCPRCKSGSMVHTGAELVDTSPSRFPHRCSNDECGYMVNYKGITYPRIEVED